VTGAFIRSAVLALSVLGVSGLVNAQDFPSRGIKIIVPNPPGGAGDIGARLVSQRLNDVFRQPVVVENQAGASGALGMTNLKRAAPDGHTIGVVLSLSQTIDRVQNKTASFDIATDFTPITAIANNPAGLLVNSQISARTMAEFIEEVRAKPRSVSYGSAGIGTAHHLYGQVLNKVAGIELVNVPYRGVAPALNDVIPGRVDMMFNTAAGVLQQVRSGQLRGLAVSSAQRFSTAMEFPPVADTLPGFDVTSWYAFFVPIKTPADVIRKIHADTVTVLAEPAIKARLVQVGVEVVASTPGELDARLRAETEQWGPIIKAAGIKAEE
jgi:tripartite-type tricarboxylate transporter receptor subunit TctC